MVIGQVRRGIADLERFFLHPLKELIVPQTSVGIHWFGQSSFGFKHPNGTIVQVDPYYPKDRPPDKFIHTSSPLDETTLRTHLVLLTHDHSDHTWTESINRIRQAYLAVQFIGPAESARRIIENGVSEDKVSTVTAGDRTLFQDLTIHAVWAKPPEGAPDDNISPPDVTHLGYVVDTGHVRIYISGDPINTFAKYESLLKPIRDLQPDIGLLTNHPTEGEFPFFDGSIKMAVELGLKTAVPAHYSCFVERDYDPQEWARHLPADGPKPLIIGYDESVIYSP